MEDEELQTYLDALAAQLADVDNRLDAQAGRLWAECAQRRYDWQRPWRTSERVKGLTRPQLLAFYDEHVADGSPTRRRLATHVFAPAGVPAELRLDELPADFYDPPPDRMARSTAGAVAKAGQNTSCVVAIRSSAMCAGSPPVLGI